MKRTLLEVVLGASLLFLPPVSALPDTEDWNELQWSKFIAEKLGGEVEHRLPDGARVDILTDEVAWEVDWCTKSKAGKHWEAPAQAIFGAVSTGSMPGVILLYDGSETAKRAYLRCLVVCSRTDVKLRTWKVQ